MSEYVQYAVGNDNSFTGCGDFSVSFSATATDETYAVKNTNTHGLFLCDVFREHMGSDGHGVYEQKLHIPMVEGRNDSTLRYWTTNGEYYSYGRMEYRVPRNAPRLLSYTELKQDGGITVAVALKPWSTSITTHSGRSIRNAANAIHYGESTKNKKAVSVKLMKVPSNVNASASATGTITVGLVDMNSDNVAPYLTLAPVKIPIGDVKVNQATGNGSLVVDVYMPDLLANARYGRFNSVVGPEVAFDDMFDNMKIDRSGWGFAILDFDVQLITNIEV
jgi:hypothetical protein